MPFEWKSLLDIARQMENDAGKGTTNAEALYRSAELVSPRLQLPVMVAEYGKVASFLFDADQLGTRVGMVLQPVGIDQPQGPVVWIRTDRCHESGFVVHVSLVPSSRSSGSIQPQHTAPRTHTTLAKPRPAHQP